MRKKTLAVILENGGEVFVRSAGRYGQGGLLRIGRRQEEWTTCRDHLSQFVYERRHFLLRARGEQGPNAPLEGSLNEKCVALQGRFALTHGTRRIGKQGLEPKILLALLHEVGKGKLRQPQAHVTFQRSAKVGLRVRFLVDVKRRRKEKIALDTVAAPGHFRIDFDFLLDFELFGAVQLHAFLHKHGRPQ